MGQEFEKIFVKPGMGHGNQAGRRLLVRDPISLRFLKEEGELKPKTSYWLRRLRCKDCEQATPPPKATVMATPEQRDAHRTETATKPAKLQLKKSEE